MRRCKATSEFRARFQIASLDGAGLEELLHAFDEMGANHKRMEPKTFNEDSNYKIGINQVARELGGGVW